MIEIKNLTKSFGNETILKDVNLTIKDNTIFGLIGINGAGKSTLLRILSNVFDYDSGEIIFDGQRHNLIEIRKQIFLLSDKPHSEVNKNLNELIEFYQAFYRFNIDKFYEYLNEFKFQINKLDRKANINKFSKGMQRQLYLCLALAVEPKYLFLDEAFDGLDPLARLTFKKILLKLMDENDMTIIISSHSLRELEDLCDCYGLLDSGVIESSGDIESNLNKYHKFQLAFDEDFDENRLNYLNVVSIEKIGRVLKLVCVGEKEDIKTNLMSFNPIIIDELSIDFEELFILKVKKEGYIPNEK